MTERRIPRPVLREDQPVYRAGGRAAARPRPAAQPDPALHALVRRRASALRELEQR